MRPTEILRALGENTRLRIVNILLEGRNCVCELQEILDLAQVTTSKHLAKLREMNIVETKKEGNRVFYTLTEEILENVELVNLIKSFRESSQLKHDLSKYESNKLEIHNYVCPTD